MRDFLVCDSAYFSYIHISLGSLLLVLMACDSRDSLHSLAIHHIVLRPLSTAAKLFFKILNYWRLHKKTFLAVMDQSESSIACKFVLYLIQIVIRIVS